MAQLRIVNSRCDNCYFLAREQGDDIIALRDFLDTSKGSYKLLKGQIAVFREEKEAVAFKRDACMAKVSPLLEFLSGYQDTFNDIEKRLNDEVVRLEAGFVAANRAKDASIYFLRGRVLSKKICVRTHIAQARASVNERSSTVVDILCSVENELRNIMSGQSGLGDGALNVGRLVLSLDLLLLL